jgi:hypothetical protein
MLLTLSIPDADKAFMAHLIQERGYTVLENENPDFDIPEWHKEVVRAQRATAKPEDYVPLDVVLKSWGMD